MWFVSELPASRTRCNSGIESTSEETPLVGLRGRGVGERCRWPRGAVTTDTERKDKPREGGSLPVKRIHCDRLGDARVPGRGEEGDWFCTVVEVSGPLWSPLLLLRVSLSLRGGLQKPTRNFPGRPRGNQCSILESGTRLWELGNTPTTCARRTEGKRGADRKQVSEKRSGHVLEAKPALAIASPNIWSGKKSSQKETPYHGGDLLNFST